MAKYSKCQSLLKKNRQWIEIGSTHCNVKNVNKNYYNASFKNATNNLPMARHRSLPSAIEFQQQKKLKRYSILESTLQVDKSAYAPSFKPNVFRGKFILVH